MLTRICALLALVLLLLPVPGRTDGTLMSWGPQSIEGMTAERWAAAQKAEPAAILERIRTASSWAECYEALLGASSRKEDRDFLRKIAAEISSTSETRLTGTGGLIIWERITAGDVLFEGKGLWIEDDLFRAGGRANWILRTVLEKHFGAVTPVSTPADLTALSKKWEDFLAGKVVPEYSSPYQTKEKGLEELRSPAAVQALVVSLQPSAAKEAHVQRCLKKIYGLDKLPTEPGAPGRLCNPDLMTQGNLAQITGVTEEHDAAWWEQWWNKHRETLRWNPEKGQFLAPGT